MISEDVRKYVGVEDNHPLPQWAWPGGYPLYYMDDQCNVLCAQCATNSDELDPVVTEADVNCEDEDLYCDECSMRIESAYE